MQKAIRNRMLTKEIMNSRVNAAYEKYIKRFMRELKKKDSYRPECYAHDTEDGKVFKQFIEDQIEFIGMYLGFMLIAGPHQENLNRIRSFLNMQGAIKDQDKIEIRFINGRPYEVYVYVDSLNDVDLEDIQSLIEFNTLRVCREGGKKWTKQKAETFFADVQKDMEYGEESFAFDYTLHGDLLEIYCECQEDSSI